MFKSRKNLEKLVKKYKDIDPAKQVNIGKQQRFNDRIKQEAIRQKSKKERQSR